MAITLEHLLGTGEADVYQRLLDEIPAGLDTLKRGLVIPSHPANNPRDFILRGLRPNEPYKLEISADRGRAPQTSLEFVPTLTSHSFSLALPLGQSDMTLTDSISVIARFTASVVHYAAFLLVSARQISERMRVPLTSFNDQIAGPFAFRLALPLIGDLTKFIPNDLELLATLSHKLIVKTLLHEPGTDIGVNNLLASFGGSNPVFNAMKNFSRVDEPLYRSEEDFAGYEAHLWMPNKEVERWGALIKLLGNVSQIYNITEIAEELVVFEQEGRVHQHYFDFDSMFANTVVEGSSECFLNLFKVAVSVTAEHHLAFCQAAYRFDTQIPLPGLITDDTDLLAITNWTLWSLTGRFEQQYDISYDIHDWQWDDPVTGIIDGVNRFFSLTQTPANLKSVKLFLDGLLLSLNVHYRITSGSSFRASTYFLLNSDDPQYAVFQVGIARPFLAPVLSSVEIFNDADVQFLVTAGPQTLTDISFVISNNPQVLPVDPQSARLHYVTPTLLAGAYGGANQYGTITVPALSTSVTLTYPTAASDIDYQLLVQLAEDPLPGGGGPSAVDQVFHMVRGRTLVDALIEFSAPITSANVSLHWWLIEDDGVGLERGSLALTAGSAAQAIVYTAGPYLDDSVAVLVTLWETSTFGTIDQLLVSTRSLTPFGFVAQFSDVIPATGDYRLDYVLFPVESGGNLIEVFSPPELEQTLQAHYDLSWPYWAQEGLTPLADSIRTEFSLSTPVVKSQSVYLALNGRLMTQGPGLGRQYQVATPNSIVMNFAPQEQQLLWAVYPLADPVTNELPSWWNQSVMRRSSVNGGGSFSTGLILNAAEISQSDTVTINLTTLTGVNTASGSLVLSGAFTLGSSVLFQTSGVTLTATGIPLTENQFAGGVSITADAAALTAAINVHSILSPKFLAVNLLNGTISLRARSLTGTASNEILSVVGTLFIAANNITGDSAETVNGFAVGVSRAIDSAALANKLTNHLELKVFYRATSTTGIVTLTALTPTPSLNAPITLTGSSMTTPLGIQGGERPSSGDPYFLTNSLFYYQDAPIVTLDGVATRLYDAFGGQSVRFDFLPEPQQEPYLISQSYPIDYHPLDSFTANQPDCNYPKGIFTQGLNAQLTDFDAEIEQPGEMIITVTNLPVQEEPQGVQNGINTEFLMTTESCAGQDSMMVWVDGIFQPPDQWSYSVMVGQGKITFITAPTADQDLWCWYLVDGAACAEEHVEALVGAIDGVNQTYTIPSGPTGDDEGVLVFLEGLFNLQGMGEDYVVNGTSDGIIYNGALAPATGQTLWVHFNEAVLTVERWRQVAIGVGDDVTTVFDIPISVPSDKPIAQLAVIAFFDGFAQRNSALFDFAVGVDGGGFPTTTITFAVPPESGRIIEVAYIKIG